MLSLWQIHTSRRGGWERGQTLVPQGSAARRKQETSFNLSCEDAGRIAGLLENKGLRVT